MTTRINVASVDALTDIAAGLSAADRLRITAEPLEDGTQDIIAPDDLVVQLQALIADPSSGLKARLSAYASDKRWRKEIGGFNFNGITVPTDDRAKLLLMGAAGGMEDGSSAPLIVGGVNYGTMTKAQFQAINSALTDHVQATFPLLAGAISAINAGTITTVEQIDEHFA